VIEDRVCVVADHILEVFRTDQNWLVGRVEAIFDTCRSGWQIDLMLDGNRWWRWQPSQDGGQIFRKPKNK
jgi:hypothetical protein